jgi:surfeit locus 1 family protein
MRLQRSTAVLLGFVAVGTVVLVALGAWQLGRHQEKQDLTRERDASIAAAPLPAAAAAALEGDAVDYRRVTLDGEWDYANLQVIANRTRFGQRGEEVVVPLVPAGGSPAMLVNRGWYRVAERDAVLASLAEGDAGLEGLARSGRSLSATQALDGSWTRFDVASIAELLPYAVVPWRVTAGALVEDPPRSAPPERPVTGYEGYANSTPHIEYALTWFGLAVAMVVTTGVRLYRGSGRAAPDVAATGARKGSEDGHEAA